jgi:ATP-binding cassette subfamily B protein
MRAQPDAAPLKAAFLHFHHALLVLREIGSLRWVYGVVVLCVAGAAALATVPAILYRTIYDTIASRQPVAVVLTMAGFLIGVHFLATLLSASVQMLVIIVNQVAQKRLTQRMINTLICAKAGTLRDAETGQLLGRITQDAGALVGWMTTIVTSVVSPLFTLGAAGIVLYRMEWRFLVIALALFTVTAIITQVSRRSVEVTTTAVQQDQATILHRLTDLMRSIYELQLTSSPRAFLDAIGVDYDTLRKSMVGMWVSTVLPVSVSSLLYAVANAATIAYGAFLVAHDRTTIGTLIGSMSLIAQLSGSVQVLVSARVRNFQIKSSCVRLLDILELPQGRTDDEPDVLTMQRGGEPIVEAKDVVVRAGTRDVIQGVSLSIERGATVRLHGPNGSGKSTLCRTLAGLEPLASGNITFDNVPVNHLSRSRLRKCITMVVQNPHIFSGSLRFNITCWSGELSQRTFDEVCRITGANDIAARFPDGMLTKVGDGGVRLSGGETCQVAIARALALSPDVLVLDESLVPMASRVASRTVQRIRAVFPQMAIIIIGHHVPSGVHIDTTTSLPMNPGSSGDSAKGITVLADNAGT